MSADRAKLARELAGRHLSSRAIAEALGVSHPTVLAELSASGPRSVVGTDGKLYLSDLDRRRRQTTVIRLAGAGMSNRAIATALGVGRQTVARDLAADEQFSSRDEAEFDGARLRATATLTAAIERAPEERRPRAENSAPAVDRYSFARLGLDGSVKRIAARLDVSTTTIHRWRTSGLTADQADRLAVAVGRHPAEVWPDWAECEREDHR